MTIRLPIHPVNAASHHKGILPGEDPRSKAPVQLYDLSSDPFEEHNLAEQYPEVTARLQKAYKYLTVEIKQNTRPRGELLKPTKKFMKPKIQTYHDALKAAIALLLMTAPTLSFTAAGSDHDRELQRA